MNQFEIAEIKGREILDCRGDPTLQVDVITREGIMGRADVPSGRSKGKYEAFELRDGGKRFHGKGVLKAVKKVNEIVAPSLKGYDVTDQSQIDKLLIELDGTKNKSKLGANTTTGVSLAIARVAANALKKPLYRHIGGSNAHILPVPLFDLIEGGKLAATELDFQEHHVIPTGADTFSNSVRMGMEVYQTLGQILKEKYGKHSLNVGVEGGYTPPGIKDPRVALDMELLAIEKTGYEDKFVLGLDVAASHFYNKETKKYHLMGKEITTGQFIDFYKDLVSTYPVKTIEDPLQEEDFEGIAELTRAINIQIIGDDLFVTNIKRLQKGIAIKAANALLLKVNQIGTLSEALDVAKLCIKNRYGVQVSERSGQSEDTWLADLTVALNAGQIKTGVTRSERTAQYNRLFQIEEELGEKAAYPGINFRNPWV